MAAISFVVGLRWGVVGVAIAYTIEQYLQAGPIFTISFRLIDLKVRHFFAQLRSIMVATVILGIVAFVVRISLEKLGFAQDITILAIVTATSLLSYSLLIFLLDREFITETMWLIGQLRSSHGE